MAKDQEGYTNPGYISRSGVGADSLDKEMDLLVNRYNKTPIQGAEFFRVEQARAGSHKEATVGNVLEQPRLNEDTDALPWLTPVPGFRKTFTVVNLRSGVRVTRTMVERELHSKVQYMLSGLLDSARLNMEFNFSDQFNNSFTGDLGADGKDMFDDGHPFEAKDITDTWSNKETASALTHASFSTARKNMRKRTNERNDVMPVFVKQLVVPADLEQRAREIKTSELVPDNALNAKNVWRDDGWNVKVYDYLTSTTAWFLQGDIPKERDGLIYVQQVAPNVAGWNEPNVDIMFAQRLRLQYIVGFSTVKGWQGNSGA